MQRDGRSGQHKLKYTNGTTAHKDDNSIEVNFPRRLLSLCHTEPILYTVSTKNGEFGTLKACGLVNYIWRLLPGDTDLADPQSL